jgi:predicted nucleic acid-binding protein
VLDASVAVAWLVAGQGTAATEVLLAEAHLHDFEAPHIFPVEVRNTLLKLERIRRSAPHLTTQALQSLSAYDIEIEPPPSPPTYDAILDLARSERLSIYDALYLWQAMRAGLPLASRDGGLLAAGTARNVPLLDLR